MKTTFLKNTFFYFALLVGMATAFTACQPEDGNIGPKGTQGENGAAGSAGDKGPNGTLLNKSGFIMGTITGKGKDGVTPINETFRFEYTEDNAPLLFEEINGGYFLTLARVDSSQASSAEFHIFASPDFSSAQFIATELEFHKKVSDAQYKFLEGTMDIYQYTDAAPGKITNFKYDAGTGIVSGDYSWTADNTDVNTETNNYNSSTSTGQPLTVTGSFNLLARKGSY
jgi:hypothetical protein